MKNIILILLIFVGNQVFAQDSLSLTDCIAYALNNHRSVQVYKNNVTISKAQAAQALGLYLPNVNASVSAVDNLKLQTTILPAGIVGTEAKEVQFGRQYNTSLGIEINQTLWDKSKLINIKEGKSYTEMSEIQLEQNNENIIYNTATAYLQVLIYQEQLNLLESNKIKYQEMVKVLEYQYNKGIVLERDLDRVIVNLNTTNNQIDDSKTKEILAINTLKNTMGMDINESLTIKEKINYDVFTPMTMGAELDLNNLTENKLAELSVTLQEFNVKLKQASYLPTISFVGKWNNQSQNNNFSDAFTNWHDYSYVGFSVNIPLFNGLRRKNSIKEEKLKLKNEKLNLKLNQENLQLQFDNSKSAMATAYSSYKSNKDNMELAKKVLSVTDYQYQRGVANLTDYLNDDAAYKAAQSTYISSLYNLMISQLSYKKSQGKLYKFIENIK